MELYLNVKNYGLVEEVTATIDEVELKDDGFFYIKGKPHRIMLLGDETNVPKGFLKDCGDGTPRILCDWRGMENQWMLEDIIFVVEDQNK